MADAFLSSQDQTAVKEQSCCHLHPALTLKPTATPQVIAELDEKKQEALQKTWTEVNQKFGSIFSTLLPGTSAKLEPQEGRSFLDGGCDLVNA